MSDFNTTFNRLLKIWEARDKKRTRLERKLEMGDTAAGRSLAGGTQRANELDTASAGHRGNYKVREYKQNPGASKGRGRHGGIRK
jgi:hypothetical protein